MGRLGLSTRQVLTPWKRRFSGCDSSCRGSVSQCAALVRQICQQERPNKISNVAGDPALGQVLGLNLSLLVCGSDQSRISSEQLSTCRQGHDQSKWKSECTKNNLITKKKASKRNVKCRRREERQQYINFDHVETVFRTFCRPGFCAAMPGQAPPTVIAKYAPNAMWHPETTPRVKIFFHGAVALAAPAATAP